MGFIKRAFSKPKPQAQPVAQNIPAQATESTEEQKAKKKKSALVAANAGSNQVALSGGAGGANDVTRKILLGL